MSYRSPIRRVGSGMEALVFKFQRDQWIGLWLAAAACAIALVSLVSGLTVWPVVYTLRKEASPLGQICAFLGTIGGVGTLVMGAGSLLIALFQRTGYRMLQTLIASMLLLWVLFFAVLLMQNGVVFAQPGPDFCGYMLWMILSLFFGYVLAIAPALLISLVVAAICKLADMFLG